MTTTTTTLVVEFFFFISFLIYSETQVQIVCNKTILLFFFEFRNLLHIILSFIHWGIFCANNTRIQWEKHKNIHKFFFFFKKKHEGNEFIHDSCIYRWGCRIIFYYYHHISKVCQWREMKWNKKHNIRDLQPVISQTNSNVCERIVRNTCIQNLSKWLAKSYTFMDGSSTTHKHRKKEKQSGSAFIQNTSAHKKVSQ